MGFRKLLGLFGKQADELAPTIRKTTLPDEVPPQVLGEGRSTAQKAADISDADFTDLPDEVKKRIDPRLLKVLGGTTAAGTAGMALMSGDEQPISEVTPIASKIKEPIKSEIPADYMEKAQAEALEQPLSAKPKAKITPESIQQDKKQIEQAVTEQPEKELTFEQMLKEAQEQAKKDRIGAKLTRAGELIGAGLARVKPTHELSEAEMEEAAIPVKDVTARIGAKKDQQSYDKLKAELADDTATRDPNSKISQAFRESYAYATGKQLPEGTTARHLLDMGFNGSTLLSTKIAADSRRDMMKMHQENRQMQREESNKFKAMSSVDKQYAQFLKSPDYEAYNKAKDAKVLLDSAIASGDKTDVGAAFMHFGKTAQGDESVLRDGDMRVLAGGYNYTSPQQMISKLMAKARGGDFNAHELQQMKQITERVSNLKRERLQQQFSPIMERIQSHNLNASEFVNPNVVQEFSGQAQSSAQPAQQTGSMVKVRRIADGATKMMSADKAAQADPTKYEIVR